MILLTSATVYSLCIEYWIVPKVMGIEAVMIVRRWLLKFWSFSHSECWRESQNTVPGVAAMQFILNTSFSYHLAQFWGVVHKVRKLANTTRCVLKMSCQGHAVWLCLNCISSHFRGNNFGTHYSLCTAPDCKLLWKCAIHNKENESIYKWPNIILHFISSKIRV